MEDNTWSIIFLSFQRIPNSLQYLRKRMEHFLEKASHRIFLGQVNLPHQKLSGHLRCVNWWNESIYLFLIHLCCRIIGLYVGFVWLVGKFVRLFFTSISYRIMFDEMPNVDKVLKLCLDIFMVRESKELELEEDLFAKLMFLYRSPQTLIKWTKYKRQ